MLNMEETMGTRMLQRLRKLYRDNAAAKRLLDWAAGRTNDAAQTTIERLAWKADLDRKDAVKLARELEDIGCGEFIVGRRGGKTRIAWSFSLKSIGEAAANRSERLEPLDQDLKEETSEVGQDSSSTSDDDAISIRLSASAQKALHKEASTRAGTTEIEVAREVLEAWAAAKSAEGRGASISRAVNYLRQHKDWQDDPAAFFPEAKK